MQVESIRYYFEHREHERKINPVHRITDKQMKTASDEPTRAELEVNSNKGCFVDVKI